MKQCEKYLQLPFIGSYCNTRFTSFYEVVQQIGSQAPLLRKIIDISNERIQAIVEYMFDKDIADIRKTWDDFNEHQVQRLLKRYRVFLRNAVVRRYLICTTWDAFSDATFRALNRLSIAVGAEPVKVRDEFIRAEFKKE